METTCPVTSPMAKPSGEDPAPRYLLPGHRQVWGPRGRKMLSPRAAKSAARGSHVSGGPRPAEAQAEAELTCQQNPPASRRSFRLKSLNAGRFLSRLKASLLHRTQVTGAAVDTGPTERVLTVHAEGTAASAQSGHCRDPPFHFLPSLGSGVTTFLPVAA